MTALPWLFDDGGRAQAPGHGGKYPVGDCVSRAIAIATGLPYEQVYADLAVRQIEHSHGRSRSAKAARGRRPTRGVLKDAFAPYLASMGWQWVPTMKIGSGCTVHLAVGELPTDRGPLVVKCSKHLTAVVDGIIRDTYDPSRDGTRCVYGYWWRP